MSIDEPAIPTVAEPDSADSRATGKRLIRGTAIVLVCLVLAVLCGPVGTRLGVLFQTLPLPRAWYPLAFAVMMAGSLALIPGYLITGIAIPLGALIALIFKGSRKYALLLALMSVVAWCSLPINWEMEPLKDHGMRRAARAAAPIITAIERYKADHGKAPDTLLELIPEYISEIPYTTMVGYPQFRYRTPGERDLFKEYELWIPTSIGILNWDTFFHWTEGNYPDNTSFGSIERIGDWAYLHE